ncbi:MAG TPA: Crp/Fnr family transcriptional regulator [Steroidobacteraceae bacterium]|nr:Crp/Fnr family transcriptional regulator [Steroidobacteraceae bacterium]
MNRGTERLLARLGRLSWLDEAAARELAAGPWKERRFSPREHLVHERSTAEAVFLLTTGFACRYKMSPDGRRQIIGLLLPGDICGLRMFIRQQVDHSICALRSTWAAVIRCEAVAELLDRRPLVGQAMWWLTAAEDSITRQWVVNVGYRNAYERVAHLLCEIFWRLERAGLARDGVCEMPLTQIELGDALALSSVHVNRTLMEMRRARLVRLQAGRLELLDRGALELAAGFDPQYLADAGATCSPCPEPPSCDVVRPAPPPG